MVPQPFSTVLITERLHLRLADPDDPTACTAIIRLYNDPHSGLGGNALVNVKTPQDVLRKYELHGPKARFCTLAPPPKGIGHLIYLPNTENEDEEGTLSGMITMSFRAEMPFPDIGYAVFAPYQGHGYA